MSIIKRLRDNPAKPKYKIGQYVVVTPILHTTTGAFIAKIINIDVWSVVCYNVKTIGGTLSGLCESRVSHGLPLDISRDQVDALIRILGGTPNAYIHEP